MICTCPFAACRSLGKSIAGFCVCHHGIAQATRKGCDQGLGGALEQVVAQTVYGQKITQLRHLHALISAGIDATEWPQIHVDVETEPVVRK